VKKGEAAILPWQQDGNNLLLHLFVQPRASRNHFCGIHDGRLKLQLTSPPVDGAANLACCEFLAKQFKVPKTAVSIIAGANSRHKRVRIDSATVEQIRQLIKT
jgi:uncharacterized protein (TIGR00251 family)